MNRHIRINYIEDAREFAEALTLTDSRREHSWAGSSGTVQEGEVLYGGEEIQFGSNYYYEYSNNGSQETPSESYSCPSFDIDKTYAVKIEEHYWDNYNSNRDIDENEYRVIIYKGKKDNFKIDEDLLAIIDKYKLKNQDDYEM